MTIVDKDRIVGALRSTWMSIDALCDSLPVSDWRVLTDCPGWTVQDQVAHIIGTESYLAGRPAPDIEVGHLDYLRNPIARGNEVWIEERRAWTPAAVLDEFRSITATRAKALEAMTQADFDAASFTPAGDDTYGRFMQIRVMDCWMHEQDIRHAVGRPGHEQGPAVEVSLEEVLGAIGYIVGKRGGAPSGSSVRLVLTGPAGRTVDVAVSDRARVVEGLSGTPTVTVTLPVTTFMRLAGGRTDAAAVLGSGAVELEGDAGLGAQVATHFAYTI